MSEVNRAALKLIAESLGRAHQSLNKSIGNLDRLPAARLQLESVLCRLRGATLFHDSDYARNYLQFGGSDLVGLGVQGAKVTAYKTTATAFPTYTTGTWNPGYDGPPAPEGWGFWKYNSWKGNQITSVGGAGVDATRITFNYPVKYMGSSTYNRVPFWEQARYISLYNATGSTIDPTSVSDDGVVLALSANQLEGIKLTNHLTDAPVDIRFFAHPALIQSNTISPTVGGWENIALPTTGDVFDPIPYEIIPGASTGDWTFKLNIPATITDWDTGKWWHIVMYWGSLDPLAIDSPPSYITPSAEITPANIFWPRKRFFRGEILTHFEWDNLGINDANAYLLANKRTHFIFNDGEYSQPIAPVKYTMPDAWPTAAANGVLKSLTGYSEVQRGSAIPVLLTAKTVGDQYDSPRTEPLITLGPAITPEFWPEKWEDCPYFPQVPEYHVELARMVVVRAPGAIYEAVEQYTSFIYFNPAVGQDTRLAKLAVAWIKQTTYSHALPPLGDENLSLYILPRLKAVINRLRALNYTSPAMNAAFQILVPAARVNNNLAPSRASLLNPTGSPSKVFRGMLKKPLDPLLTSRPVDESLAIPFQQPAISLITELAGAPPSTELLRLDADNFYLTGAFLPVANELEIFQAPSDQCNSVDNTGSGEKVGRDYTLRLELEDGNENILTKNWYIMSSKYFVTQKEYSILEDKSGYYTPTTIISASDGIEEYRLHGYAGLVPDLSIGISRPLRTRVVSPPDGTKQTESQFRNNLLNQGKTQKQIDEAVLQYIEDGGEFLVINTNQYDNKFTKLKSASISVAEYTTATEGYWQLDQLFHSYFFEDSGQTVASLRCDSFTIAQSGLAAGFLEQYDAALTPLSGFNHSSATGTDKTLDKSLYAFEIEVSEDTRLSQIGMRLKVVLDGGKTVLDNGDESYLKITLCIDNDGIPGQVVALGSILKYSDITLTTYNEERFLISYNLVANSTYWLVVEQSLPPKDGVIKYDSNNSGTTVIQYLHPDTTEWTATTGTPWMVAYPPAPIAYGAFNRNTFDIEQYLPPPNNKRNKGSYHVDGYWSWTGSKISASQLSIYPRAVFDTDDDTWKYVRYSEDVYVIVRLRVGKDIKDVSIKIDRAVSDASTAPIEIPLGGHITEGIAYIGIGKTANSLDTATHGAPSSDFLVIRSS